MHNSLEEQEVPEAFMKNKCQNQSCKPITRVTTLANTLFFKQVEEWCPEETKNM